MKVFKNISKLYTLEDIVKKDGRKILESDLSFIKNAAMVVDKSRIVWLGKENKIPPQFKTAKAIDCKAKVLMPAFTECHTHLIFAGSRAQEFELRNQGISYQEIAKRGGGILSTLNATRKASEEELIQLGQERLNNFIKQGITTVEVKSGYGLNYTSERKILRAAKALKNARIISSYLGPHSVPKEYKSLKNGMDLYVQNIIKNDLPKLNKEKLVDRVDIFIEKGFFEIVHGEAYMLKAQELGLDICVHADQLSRTGAARLGIKFAAKSVDHAVFLNSSDRKKLANSSTVAVCLPGADLYIHAAYPNARKMIDDNCKVALATDFNPGSCPTQDLSFIGCLARLKLNMTLAEVIAAYTYNAASALGLEKELGSLEIGKKADFIVLESDIYDLFYRIGYNPVISTFKEGKKLY